VFLGHNHPSMHWSSVRMPFRSNLYSLLRQYSSSARTPNIFSKLLRNKSKPGDTTPPTSHSTQQQQQPQKVIRSDVSHETVLIDRNESRIYRYAPLLTGFQVIASSLVLIYADLTSATRREQKQKNTVNIIQTLTLDEIRDADINNIKQNDSKPESELELLTRLSRGKSSYEEVEIIAAICFGVSIILHTLVYKYLGKRLVKLSILPGRLLRLYMYNSRGSSRLRMFEASANEFVVEHKQLHQIQLGVGSKEDKDMIVVLRKITHPQASFAVDSRSCSTFDCANLIKLINNYIRPVNSTTKPDMKEDQGSIF